MEVKMGEIKSLKVSMEAEGGELFKANYEFNNTTLKTVLLQQKAFLEGQLNLVNLQLEGKI
jgi:hypothetical protein